MCFTFWTYFPRKCFRLDGSTPGDSVDRCDSIVERTDGDRRLVCARQSFDKLHEWPVVSRSRLDFRDNEGDGSGGCDADRCAIGVGFLKICSLL